VGKNKLFCRDSFSLHTFVHRCGKIGRGTIPETLQAPPRSDFAKL